MNLEHCYLNFNQGLSTNLTNAAFHASRLIQKPTEGTVDFRKRLYRSTNNQNIKCF